MKTILTLFLLACAPFTYAQGTDTNIPPDLAAARTRYQDALTNVKNRYLQELQKLKADAVVENNSELVDAVTKEIASLGGTDTGSADAGADLDGTEGPTIESLTARLTNTTWAWFNDQTITFLRNGMAKWSNIAAATFTWSVVSASPPTIQGKSGDGTAYKMVLDANLRTGQIFQGTLPERTTARIRRQ
jgi:hypothetical protein